MEAAIAVAGITIQLADTLHKLITFWKEVQRAPAEVCSLFEDVETLSALLAQAQSSNHDGRLDGLAETVLGRCEGKVAALYAKVRKATLGLTSESARKRKWSALKIALDKADITELRSELKEAKAMLIVVKLESFERSTSSKLQTQQQILLEVLRAVRLSTVQSFDILSWTKLEWQKSEMQLLTAPATGPPNYTKDAATACSSNTDETWVESSSLRKQVQKRPRRNSAWISGSSSRINTPFGPVKTWSSVKPPIDRREDANKAEDQDKTFALYPSWLLRRLGISYGLWIEGRNSNGWLYTIKPFNAVPEDAPIFRYCRVGDIAAIKTLLSCGYASVRDRDPRGRTPLWYASRSLQVEVADFLLEHGADAHAVDWESKRSAIAAVNYNSTDLEKKTTMINIYERHEPDGYDEESLLYLVGITMITYRSSRSLELCPAEIDRERCFIQLVNRILELLCPDDAQRTKIFRDALACGYSSQILHWLLSSIEVMDEPHDDWILHDLIDKGFLLLHPVIITLAVEKMRKHHGHQYVQSTSVLSSATSLAIAHPASFFAWRDILLGVGHDLDKFVAEELGDASSALFLQGWRETTLLSLFRSEPFPATIHRVHPTCDRCGQQYKSTKFMVDVPWMRYLERVRQGRLTPVSKCVDVQGISIDFRDGVASKIDHSSVPTDLHNSMELAASFPYRLVCKVRCKDKVCVPKAPEGVSAQDVFVPPYPCEETIEEEEAHAATREGDTSYLNSSLIEDDCPSRKMPGAFGD